MLVWLRSSLKEKIPKLGTEKPKVLACKELIEPTSYSGCMVGRDCMKMAIKIGCGGLVVIRNNQWILQAEIMKMMCLCVWL